MSFVYFIYSSRITTCVKEAAWHRATAALPGGEYSLVFEATYNAQWSAENVALDNIQVDDGPCNFS